MAFRSRVRLSRINTYLVAWGYWVMSRRSLFLPGVLAMTTWAQTGVPPASPPIPATEVRPATPRRIRIGQVQEKQCLGPAGFWICGATLSEGQLMAYERTVLLNPEDLCARGQIISRGTKSSRVDHLLWMIQHHPEWDGFTANPLYSLANPPGLPLERSNYELVKRAWLQQIV